MAEDDRAGTESGKEIARARYEVFFGVLALLSIVFYLLIRLDISPLLTGPLIVVDFLLNFVFLGDFFISLRHADSKRAYFLRAGWLDLLSCIPVPRIFRLARLWRLFRASTYLRRQGYRTVLREFLANRAESSLAGASILAVLLIVVSSAIIVPLESDAPGANILAGDDALWWAFVTVTTVGYGDRFPVTDAGRFVAAILMTVGVGLFGLLTSYLATNFLSHDQQPDQQGLIDELTTLRKEMMDLRQALEKQKAVNGHGDSQNSGKLEELDDSDQ